MQEETTRIYADRKLLDDLKKAYPETRGMTYTGLVDWLMRWAILQAKLEVKVKEV